MPLRLSLAALPRCLCGMLVLACCAPSTTAQDTQPTPAQWQIEQIAAFNKSEQVFDRARKVQGLLEQYQLMRNAYDGDKGAAFHAIFSQYVSWYQTYIGDYVAAERSFSIAQPALPGDAPSPLADPRWHALPALDAIAALAQNRKAVFFNENHSAPITRTLTVQLLAKLRADGYNTFAAETLYNSDMPALARRGYPVRATGFYTEEPIYAEMVRTALKLGYRVIAYEAESDATGDAREREQAQNLYDRAFKGHPHARLVVNAGYAHIQKQGVFLGGQSMAEHFMRISGIDPLAVEQTMLFGHINTSDDQPIWRAVIAALHPPQPIVFEDAAGKPWSLRPGAYDVSVFFPQELLVRDRPTWLSLGGLRFPYQIGDGLCMDHFPCLVDARYKAEGSDAIPADRLVIECPGEVRQLWLRPGRYRLSARDLDDHVLLREEARVTPQPPLTDGAPPSTYREHHCSRDRVQSVNH